MSAPKRDLRARKLPKVPSPGHKSKGKKSKEGDGMKGNN